MISLFTGENSFLIQREVKQLEASFAGDIERFDGSELTIDTVPDIFMGVTLFGSNRLIVIKELSLNSAIWTELDTWLERVSDETHIILIEEKPDKRTRTYKWLQKHATVSVFAHLQERDLEKWLPIESRRLGFELSPATSKTLIHQVGVDQWELVRALEKLALINVPITDAVIREYIIQSPHATAFELLDAIIERNADRAEAVLADVVQTEDPYRFIGLLSSQLYNLAACFHADGKSAQDIARDLGVHPYPIQRMVQATRRLSAQDVELFVDTVAGVDRDVKTKGIDPWTAIRIAVGQMTAPAK